MTTTPVNIDYNGLQINSQNNDISITFTMDGSDKGIIFQYDKTTANPKTFKITSSGFDYTDNTTNYTTPLANISLLSQVLSSVQLPPDNTTLKINKQIILDDLTNNASLNLNSGNLDINLSTGQVNFSQTPHSSNLPVNADDLTNKTYVDNNVYNIISTNNNQNYYPIFASTSGVGQQLYIDQTTGPFTFNPSNGSIVSNAMNIDTTVPCIRMGSSAKLGTYGAYTIAIGTNTGLTQSTNCIAIGQNSGTPLTVGNSGQQGDCIAIGAGSGRENQGLGCVALGVNAGQLNQGAGAVAIGNNCGLSNQGIGAVAIGSGTGQSTQGNYSIALGFSSGGLNQAVNSITINGSGTAMSNTVSNSFAVKPVRRVDNGQGAGKLFYNSTTGEITYTGT